MACHIAAEGGQSQFVDSLTDLQKNVSKGLTYRHKKIPSECLRKPGPRTLQPCPASAQLPITDLGYGVTAGRALERARETFLSTLTVI